MENVRDDASSVLERVILLFDDSKLLDSIRLCVARTTPKLTGSLAASVAVLVEEPHRFNVHVEGMGQRFDFGNVISPNYCKVAEKKHYRVLSSNCK